MAKRAEEQVPVRGQKSSLRTRWIWIAGGAIVGAVTFIANIESVIALCERMRWCAASERFVPVESDVKCGLYGTVLFLCEGQGWHTQDRSLSISLDGISEEPRAILRISDGVGVRPSAGYVSGQVIFVTVANRRKELRVERISHEKRFVAIDVGQLMN